MNTLAILILAFAAPTGWMGILFTICVICIIAWAIWALVQWSGWPIPRPIQIIFIALVCIVVCYWLFKLAALMMQ